MENKQQSGYNFNSVDLLIFMWKKRVVLLGVSCLAAVASIVISMMITPMFEASVVMFPTSNTSVSKELLVQAFSGHPNVFDFGEEEQAEQLLQVLNSEPMRSRISEKYDLMKHYGISPNGKYPRTELMDQYKSNINFRLTEYMAVEIAVKDEDPEMAADIANDISNLVDTIFNGMKKERIQTALRLVKEEHMQAEKEFYMIRDSLNMVYAELTKGMDAGGSTEDLFMLITKNWAKYQMMTDQIRNAAGVEVGLNWRLREAMIEAEQVMAHKFIVEEAFVPEKKAYPNKSLIVIASTFASLLFALIVLILIDNVKARIATQEEK
jgi:uncharacterized protein involved in exopolysaccharide biosynthesis